VATTVLFVRHGETDWNLERRVQGHTNRPLNNSGREQARELAARLAGERFDAVYSSDLSRARETARIIAGERGLEVTTLPELRERHFGTWEGLTDDEVLARFPEARHRPWGDAETQEEMSARVLEALRLIADAHPRGRVLVVGHGGPMRALLRHCGTSADGPIANCHVVRVALGRDSLRLLD
jgi:broad specificity phosphatase PhoE